MNPGQVGLGSSRPGSARPGQLGLLYMVYGVYVFLIVILIQRDCSNMENII